MPINILAAFAVALTALTFALPLQAQPATTQAEPGDPAAQAAPAESLREKVATLEEKSRVAYEAGEWVSFYSANMKLSQLLPYEPEYLVNVVKACALLDRKTTAYHYMLQLQQQGVAYDFNATDDTLNIRDTEAYTYIANLMIDAGNPAGEGMFAFDLPGNPSDYSAIAWDASRELFLAGTTANGSLLSVSSVNGETETLLEADKESGFWSITGLAVDAGNNRLWMASAATPGFAGYDAGLEVTSALFELDLKTLEVLNRFDPPVDGSPHVLGSLAITQDGQVYVIDQANPLVYLKSPGGETLNPFMASPDMLEFSDIAVTPDNSRIYVSDPALGILEIAPLAEQAGMLAGPETMNLGGIVSLDYHDGNLYAVQGDFEPERVVRLELDPASGAVLSVNPMAVALLEFNRPGVGVIKGDSLFYIANTETADDSGAIVLNTPLSAGAAVVAPRMKEDPRIIRPANQ